MNIHKPRTVQEAINDFQDFLEADLWYAKTYEWKDQLNMNKYLRDHFKILKEQVKEILDKEDSRT